MGDLRELVAQHGVVLADHRIALLYECRGVLDDTAERCAHATFDHMAQQGLALPWLDAARMQAGGARSLSGRPIWRAEPPLLSPDLHTVALAILGGSSGEQAAEAARLRLTEQGLNFVDGLYCSSPSSTGFESAKPVPSGLRLRLTKSAAQYLGFDPSNPIPVKIDEMTFLPFRTGVGVAVVELRLLASAGRDPSLPQLMEATHLLVDERASRQPAFSFASRANEKFRLSDLLRPLLSGADVRVLGDRRIFSFVAAVADGAIDAPGKREIAYRLSRRYNHVYDPDIEAKEAVVLTPFNNVTHVMSLEGVATLVDRPRGGAHPDAPALPEFLSNWLSVAHHSAYLPITVIAYHEYLALLELAQEASIDLDFSHPSGRQAKALTRLCQRFFAFRLRYRPAQISRITMHNEFSEHVRLALGNDRLAQKAAQDAAEAEQVLARNARESIERAERARERRWAWHGAFLGGLVALMAVMGLFDEIGTLVARFTPSAIQQAAVGEQPATGNTAAAVTNPVPTPGTEAATRPMKAEMLPADWIKLAGILVGLLLGVIGGFISWARLRHSEHAAGEIQNELMQQNLERKQKGRQESVSPRPGAD